jgi:uncharacterized membrane protein
MIAKAIKIRLKDERGAVAVMAALSMTAILGFAAMVADLGAIYIAKRDLQAAADAAALAGTFPLAQDSTVVDSWKTVAQNYLVKNMPGATADVSRGIYCPNPATPPGARYTADATICADNDSITGYNAVHVSASAPSPLYFGRALLGGAAPRMISATATAAQINEAGFSAGTGLLSLDKGLANAILSALLGTSIDLSLVQYQGLANANVNALGFIDALATNLHARREPIQPSWIAASPSSRFFKQKSMR